MRGTGFRYNWQKKIVQDHTNSVKKALMGQKSCANPSIHFLYIQQIDLEVWFTQIELKITILHINIAQSILNQSPTQISFISIAFFLFPVTNDSFTIRLKVIQCLTNLQINILVSSDFHIWKIKLWKLNIMQLGKDIYAYFYGA